jgi:transposase-like protein
LVGAAPPPAEQAWSLVSVVATNCLLGISTREVFGLDVTSDEDGAGWLAFLRSLIARGPV